MPKDPRLLTHQQATSIYNHLGAKQDWKAFCEAPATRDLHALSPWLVGGCRPLELRDYLPGTGFHPDYTQVVTRFGVPSEVMVASKQPGEDEGLPGRAEERNQSCAC